MIMGNTHMIFLHIQIEYLKCEFWEFESTQNHLWLIFNKCLKLLKWLHYSFYCMRSTINLRLVLILLVRENSKLSAEIGFTQFGSVYELICIFEQGLCIEFKLKRKRLIQTCRLRQEGLTGRTGRPSCAQRSVRGSRECWLVGPGGQRLAANPKRYARWTVRLDTDPTAGSSSPSSTEWPGTKP